MLCDLCVSKRLQSPQIALSHPNRLKLFALALTRPKGIKSPQIWQNTVGMLSEDDGFHVCQIRKINRTLHANTLYIHMAWTSYRHHVSLCKSQHARYDYMEHHQISWPPCFGTTASCFEGYPWHTRLNCAYINVSSA